MREPIDRTLAGCALSASPLSNSNASIPRTSQANEGKASPAKNGLRTLAQPTSTPMTAL